MNPVTESRGYSEEKNHDMKLIPWGDLNSSIQNGHEHVSNSRQIVSDLTALGLGGQL